MEQTDIKEILTELQNARELVGSHRRKIEYCLQHFASKGLTLETCADSKHLNRAIETLKVYCREAEIRFPDYIPYSMRTVEERKRGPRKASDSSG